MLRRPRRWGQPWMPAAFWFVALAESEPVLLTAIRPSSLDSEQRAESQSRHRSYHLRLPPTLSRSLACQLPDAQQTASESSALRSRKMVVCTGSLQVPSNGAEGYPSGAERRMTGPLFGRSRMRAGAAQLDAQRCCSPRVVD